MFLGTHTPKLDEKGRFFLPARFREALAEGLVIAKGQERCLAIYTVAEFTEQARAATAGSATLRDVRNFQRSFGAGASEEVPDKQGRVTIPAHLRQYAGLTKDCTVIGQGSRIEVWDTDAWTTWLAEHEQAYSDTSEEVVPGLI